MPYDTYERERELRRESCPGTAQLPGQVGADGLCMEGLPEETPALSDGARPPRSSLRELLRRNLGFYVVACFLAGGREPVSWEGILYSVGDDYLVLYQPDVDRYITGDIAALQFVEFHNSKSMSPWSGYRRRDGQRSW